MRVICSALLLGCLLLLQLCFSQALPQGIFYSMQESGDSVGIVSVESDDSPSTTSTTGDLLLELDPTFIEIVALS